MSRKSTEDLARKLKAQGINDITAVGGYKSEAINEQGVEVVVGSRRFQNYDRMYFEHAGIDPATRRVLVVKSSQHFRAAYGLGHDELTISTIDSDGVSLAAIQGLHSLLLEQEARIAALEARLARLEHESPATEGAR